MLKVMAQQTVVKVLTTPLGGCGSSARIMTVTPIDISASAVDININGWKKVCAIVIDKIARTLAKQEEDKKDGKLKDKDGKRKRD